MSHGVQLSGNEMLNRKVLSSRRKVRSDEAVRRQTGRVFHARAAVSLGIGIGMVTVSLLKTSRVLASL